MRKARKSIEPPLLEQILTKGWSKPRQRAFLNDYGLLIRRSILYQLRCHFGPGGLHGVGSYLESLQRQRGVDMEANQGIQSTHLDLAVNVWEDVLREAMKQPVQESLIGKFVAYPNKNEGSGDKAPSFETFLRRSVRYKFFDNLPHRLSQKEVFDKIVDLEQEADRRFYIQEARNRYADEVKAFIRDRMAIHSGSLSNLVDYFFERFVPEKYPDVRAEFAGRQQKGQTLKRLLEAFSKHDMEQGQHHTRETYGHAAGFSTEADEKLERVGQADEISLVDEVDVFWDQLMRCEQLDPQRIERELISISLNPATALCWACAKLKGEGQREDTRRNVVAFISFYCSQRGPQREVESLPAPEALCLERLSGLYLRWDQDICKSIFRRDIRKDRIMGVIANTIQNSPYGHLMHQGTESKGA